MKKDIDYLVVTTQSGKAIIDPQLAIIYYVRYGTLNVDDVNKIESKKLVTNNEASQQSKINEKRDENGKGKPKEVSLVLKPIT